MLKRLKSFNSIGFLSIIILFVLPFIELSCNNTSLATLTGYELITGKQLFGSNDFFKQQEFNTTDKQKDQSKENQKIKPQFFIIIPFAMAVLGLLISLFYTKNKKSIFLLILALIGLASLVGFKIYFDKQLEDYKTFNFIKFKFKSGYWLSALAFLGIVIHNFLNIKRKISTTTAASIENTEEEKYQ